MTSKRPIIGVTLDIEPDNDSYSAYPWYALRCNYLESIEEFGGTPLPLPHFKNEIENYINLIDGLVMTGGFYDVDPACYGEKLSSEKVIQKDTRTEFELGMFKAAIDKNMPILGICAGEQIMNVALGGTLHQHIPDSVPNCLEHEQKTPKHQTSHSIKLDKSSKLYKICGNENFDVNSTHHQAVKMPGKGLKAVAHAPDGVIEAIEHDSHRFCIGVEWHPEYLSTEQDKNIFKKFISECNK